MHFVLVCYGKGKWFMNFYVFLHTFVLLFYKGVDAIFDDIYVFILKQIVGGHTK
jgi:hypothetical protein